MINKDFSNEVLFRVGQRVHIELPDIPKEQRDITTGLIIKINTYFPTTPKHRSIKVTIKMDGNYVKEKFRMAGGIEYNFTCDQKRLILLTEPKQEE